LSKRFKKITLKIEYLELEFEEVDELSKKYSQKFDKEFYDEMCFLKSLQNEEKLQPECKPQSSPHSSPLVQKIYRNLAKILHPDTSLREDAEEQFKKLTECSDNDDLVGIIKMASENDIDLKFLNEEDYSLIEQAISETEKKIKTSQSTISWVWFNSIENKEELRKKIYHMIGLNEEEFRKWKLEVAGIEPAS
jgi:hypothetical protein|tara:strand:+ start:1017 stop:1595 length:579 start_codon:yes stop_codon:yes gene_type:complete